MRVEGISPSIDFTGFRLDADSSWHTRLGGLGRIKHHVTSVKTWEQPRALFGPAFYGPSLRRPSPDRLKRFFAALHRNSGPLHLPHASLRYRRRSWSEEREKGIVTPRILLGISGHIYIYRYIRYHHGILARYMYFIYTNFSLYSNELTDINFYQKTYSCFVIKLKIVHCLVKLLTYIYALRKIIVIAQYMSHLSRLS